MHEAGCFFSGEDACNFGTPPANFRGGGGKQSTAGIAPIHFVLVTPAFCPLPVGEGGVPRTQNGAHLYQPFTGKEENKSSRTR